MDTPTPFDLNLAIKQWRESLAQSPALHRENLDELESHLRDSTATLQTRGLSAEESFLIATRRVGTVEKLKTEFAKVTRSPRNMKPTTRIAAIITIALFALVSSPKAITQLIVFVTLLALTFGALSLVKKLRAVKC